MPVAALTHRLTKVEHRATNASQMRALLPKIAKYCIALRDQIINSAIGAFHSVIDVDLGVLKVEMCVVIGSKSANWQLSVQQLNNQLGRPLVKKLLSLSFCSIEVCRMHLQPA